MKSITFEGQIDGDCCCFVWSNVPDDAREKIVGKRVHRLDRELGDRIDTVYPGAVMRRLKCKPGRQYRFTIQVEEI